MLYNSVRATTNLNERHSMLKKTAIVLALFGAAIIVQAQSSLGELATQAKVDWLMGDWQAVSDSGDTTSVSFKADLDKHIAFVSHKDARGESKGIIIVDPVSGEPKFYSGNSLGGSGTGVWTAEDGKAILKYKQVAADGRTTSMGITFSKVDANSMEVKIYDLNDKGELGSDPRSTVQFKRKK
jgi:hypothetical protein